MNRLPPRMPSGLYRTFAIRSPINTHYRPATCAEVACEAYLHGWRLRIEGLTPDLVYVARTSGRRYQELSVTEGETYLVYEAGQSCFSVSTHVVPLDRPEFYYAGRGDHRTFTTRKATQMSPAEWTDRFADHINRINDELQKG